MISTYFYFFADPDFLELLQFWEASRAGRALPDWSGDVGVVPRNLLANLIITDRRGPEPVYQYVGAECVRRWGSDPTGKRIYSDVLTGAHGRYIRSLGEESVARRAPIFSTAVYQPDATSVIMTGRLYAPFSYRGSPDPGAMMTLQLFRGSDTELRQIGIKGIVHEIRRDMITNVGELCARLETARRDFQISRHTRQRSLAQDVDLIAQELTGGALVPLPCLEDPDLACA
ncbi:MAG TPA: hypothetical protein VMB81_12020 [Candidatus Sulfotelmatobacter sp.]|nr:hypothetical protein [Candidatus Sulfotelmatobacter sp.]